MLRGYPKSAVQFEHVNRLSLDRTIGHFIGFLRRSDGHSTVAGGKVLGASVSPQDRNLWSLERAVTKVTPCKYVKLQVWTTRCPSLTQADGTRVHAVLGTVASAGTCISLRVPARRGLTGSGNPTAGPMRIVETTAARTAARKPSRSAELED